jgi:hypothetical protein
MINEVKIGFNEALNGPWRCECQWNRHLGTRDWLKRGAELRIPGHGFCCCRWPGAINSQANGRGAPYTLWSISYIDNLSWTHGKLKFGGELRQVRCTDRKGGITYTNEPQAFQNNTASNIRYRGDLSDPSVFNNGATGERKAEQITTSVMHRTNGGCVPT